MRTKPKRGRKNASAATQNPNSNKTGKNGLSGDNARKFLTLSVVSLAKIDKGMKTHANKSKVFKDFLLEF